LIGGFGLKICIFGAGAIGGFVGAKLADAGAEVSMVARGAHLSEMKKNGLTLIEDGSDPKRIRVKVAQDPSELGAQDYVFVTLKAHSVSSVAESMISLFHDDTTIVSGVNGIPWWYFHKVGGEFEGTRLSSVDPDNKQWDLFGPNRVLGCVVYPAAEVIKPGVIRHIEGNKFSLGEPNGEKTQRSLLLSEALRSAGLKAPVRKKIRDEIWVKLWGNLSFNPISALTHATLDVLCEDSDTRQVLRIMMLEAKKIGEKLGVNFPIDVEQRINGGAAVGSHKTSMLQDLELSRPLEIDAILGSVQELGQITKTPTPIIDTVLAIIKLRAKTAGLYTS